MRQVTITDGERTVKILPDAEYTIQPMTIGQSATMASGREVMDFTGEKDVLRLPVGWLSEVDLAALRDMIRRVHLLDITYFRPEGQRTAKFLVKQPVVKSFRYSADGAAIWYGVTLEATEYEVVS